MEKRTCSIEGCDRELRARGWCGTRYMRWRRLGDPEATLMGRWPEGKATCKLEGCGEPVEGHGWCVRHYWRWKQHGAPGPVDRLTRAPGTPPTPCSIDNCERPATAGGYCRRHNENAVRYGNPVPRKERPLEVRLREIGWTVTESGCWEWNGKRNDSGYGIFTAALLGYRNGRAHRAVYECFVSPIPEGLLLRHQCDNPPCVNPDHLTPGTDADNVEDMMERGRHWKHGRTECPNRHDLTVEGATRTVQRKKRGEDISETICVECARKRARDYARRRRAA